MFLPFKNKTAIFFLTPQYSAVVIFFLELEIVQQMNAVYFYLYLSSQLKCWFKMFEMSDILWLSLRLTDILSSFLRLCARPTSSSKPHCQQQRQTSRVWSLWTLRSSLSKWVPIPTRGSPWTRWRRPGTTCRRSSEYEHPLITHNNT